MRYVYLAVTIGLLVLGIGSYTAQAAQAEAAGSSRLIHGLSLESMLQLSTSARSDEFRRSRVVYAAQLAAEQKQRAQEQQDRDAAERFGAWGPDLVRAAGMYGQDPAALYRVMICESKGEANADNGVCKGLFQFDPGTWAGTPYGGQSIYDGKAQVEAAAWMFSQGRKGEWTCQ